jgi:ribonuclease HII
MLWVGIDEAGYGPNLGPLVMTAVIAEGPDDPRPDVWADLAETVCRAGDRGGRLWVDDSKAVYKARKGRERLDAGFLQVVEASGRCAPKSLGAWLAAVGAGTLNDAELDLWVDVDPLISSELARPGALSGAGWRIVDLKTVIVGPRAFNEGLKVSQSKATVHFAAFAKLLSHVWNQTSENVNASVECDKHGGRHFYWDGLVRVFPEIWIDRGSEGPELSQYLMREGTRRLELSLRPRADAGNGFVALASLVSKAIREHWMDAFNAYWLAKIPDLKPTAGYPVDAARFRRVIEPHCEKMGLDRAAWWRDK